MHNKLKNLIKNTKEIFKVEIIDKIARKTQFVKRKSPITSEDFLAFNIFHGADICESSLSQLASKYDSEFGVLVSKQALNNRFNDEAIEFLKEVFNEMLYKQNSILSELEGSLKLNFNRVIINDNPTFTTHDKDHGRIEVRKYYLVDEIEWLENKEDWESIRAIGMVERTRIIGEKETFERSYYITSLNSVELFSNAVRQHWGIENSLHWVLDVSFNEDKNKVHDQNAAQNLAVLRYLALNLLRQETSCKKSLSQKKYTCSLNKAYLEKVLIGPLRGKE